VPWRGVATLATGVALVVCNVALAACAGPDSDRLSGQQIDAIREEDNIRQWNAIVPDEWNLSRPQVEPVESVDPNWRNAIVDACMKDAGFAGITEVGDSIAVSVNEPDPKAAALAYYECVAQHPLHVPAIGYLSRAWRGVLYDYLTTRIVPCLRTLGYSVVDPPSRSVYIETYYRELGWNPYDAVSFEAGSIAWLVIDARCAPPADRFGQFHP
jgi:hypothetical protein